MGDTAETGRQANGRFAKGNNANPGGRPAGQRHIEKTLMGIGKLSHMSEAEVRERFRLMNEYWGWFNVMKSQAAYPDMILERDGYIYRAEVETNAKDFINHGHDVAKCDFIICWHNNWEDCPVPVREISLDWISYCAEKRIRPYRPATKEEIDRFNRDVEKYQNKGKTNGR